MLASLTISLLAIFGTAVLNNYCVNGFSLAPSLQQRCIDCSSSLASSPSRTSQSYNYVGRLNLRLQMAATSTTPVDTDDTTAFSRRPDPTKLEVVLFGIGDLRTTDHVGLNRAISSGNTILPLFLMDLDTLSKVPGGASHVLDTEQMLLSALQCLDRKLKEDVGLNLHVYSKGERFAESLRNILDTATSRMGTEKLKEITIRACDLGEADNGMGYGPYAHLMDTKVLDSLSLVGSRSGLSVRVESWNCSLRDKPWEELHLLPSKFPEYEQRYDIKSQEAAKSEAMPVISKDEQHLSLPALETIPDSGDVLKAICESLNLDTDCSETQNILEKELNTGLYGTHWGGMESSSISENEVLSGLETFASCTEDDDLFLQTSWWKSRKLARNPNSLEHASIAWMMRGDGEDESAPIKTANLLPGEFMVRYLAAPLLFGTVSPRTVWAAASRENGLFDFVPLLRKGSVLRDLVEAREWHRLLAAKSIQDKSKEEADGSHGEIKVGYFRWHGFLCRYEEAVVAKGAGIVTNNPSKKEGIVFVHGFGASGSQWSKAIKSLASSMQVSEDEHDVVAMAPDLLGFGESEKPSLSYTQYLWESYTSSFIKEVCVRERGFDQFVIGGNSIGGYTSLGVAADDTVSTDKSIRGISASGAPGTNRCTGLVLMNSAGRILSREEVHEITDLNELSTIGQATASDNLPSCKPPPRAVARVGGNGLLAYLRPQIQSICRNVYPANPDAVDEILTRNILRDSLDPGAIGVMISGSKLPPPRTANELLGADFGSALSQSNGDSNIGVPVEGMWQGRVLVAQGILDPLNDAKGRLELLGSLRDGVTVESIDAGHCPHDEVPTIVASAIAKWMTATKEVTTKSSSVMIS